MFKVKGNNIIISTSKITKIKAKMKNRWEKTPRVSIRGENPHSKGLINSRSKNLFFDKSIPILAIRVVSSNLIIKVFINSKIFIGVIYAYFN